MDGHSNWQTDPTRRHQERYFNDNGIPTDRVRDDGIEFTDEDRVESATTDQSRSRVITRRISPPSSTSEVTIPYERPEGTQRVLVTRYAAPEVDPAQDTSTGQTPAVASLHGPVDSVERRPWWLIVTMCLLVVLLVAASLFAIQQHNDADKWRNEYHAEVANNRSEVHKTTGLFVSLLASQQRLSAMTKQKNAACLLLDNFFRYDSSVTAVCAG